MRRVFRDMERFLKYQVKNGTYIMVYTAQGSVHKKSTKYKAQSVLILCGNVLQSLCEF